MELEEEEEVEKEEEGDKETESKQENGVEEDETEDDMLPVLRKRTDSYALAMFNPMQTRARSLGRSDSYHRATRTGLVDSVSVDKAGTRHLSLMEGFLPPDLALPDKVEIQKLWIVNLLEHEKANSKYIFPLIGAIPPSSLQHFASHAVGTLRPPSSTSDYASSTPVTDDTPPQSSVHSAPSPPGFEEQTATISVMVGRENIMTSPEEQQKLRDTNALVESAPTSPLADGQFLSLPEHPAAQKSSSLPPSFEDQPPDTPPHPQNTPTRNSSRRRSLTVIPSPPGTLQRMKSQEEWEQELKVQGGRRRRSDGAIEGASAEDIHKSSLLKVCSEHCT